MSSPPSSIPLLRATPPFTRSLGAKAGGKALRIIVGAKKGTEKEETLGMDGCDRHANRRMHRGSTLCRCILYCCRLTREKDPRTTRKQGKNQREIKRRSESCTWLRRVFLFVARPEKLLRNCFAFLLCSKPFSLRQAGLTGNAKFANCRATIDNCIAAPWNRKRRQGEVMRGAGGTSF